MSRTTRIVLSIGLTAVFTTAMCAVIGILVHGAALWTVGGVTLVKASRLGRPLAVALLSAILLLRLVRKDVFLRIAGRFPARAWAFGLILATAILAGLSGDHRVHGDGREYILQTQALVFDRALRIRPEAVRDYWNRTNPYELTLGDTRPPSGPLTEASRAGGGFGGLYPDRFGDYRYYHFWAYSAFVSPLYAVFHLLDPADRLEYQSFRVANVGLLALLFMLAWRRRPTLVTAAILAATLCSPLIAYCDWQHPEIFCLALVFLSFWLADSPRGRTFAPLVLGIAASQNLPTFFFFPCHLLLTLEAARPRTRADFARLAAAYAAGAAASLSSTLYFLYFFRTPSVIAHIGLASLSYASMPRVVDIFFSPFVGAVVFFPAAIALLPAAYGRGRRVFMLAALACVTAAAWLSSSTSNFNAGQAGCLRYTVWLLGPLWYAVIRGAPERLDRTWRGGLLAAGVVLTVCGILFFRTHQFLRKDLRRFACAQRAQPEVAALVRHLPWTDDLEILVENIAGGELPRPRDFRGVYLWDLGRDAQLWVLSGDAACRPVFLRTANGQRLLVRADPLQSVDQTREGDEIRLQFQPPPTLRTHPVFGRYVLLRSLGPLTDVRADQPLVVRSRTINAPVE